MATLKSRVILPHSSVVDKSPTIENTLLGELYVNSASGDGKSFLSTRKMDDTLASFHEDKYWEDYIWDSISSVTKDLISDNVLISQDITLSGVSLTISGDTLTDALNNTLSVILEDEKVTATALNKLNDKIDSMSGTTGSYTLQISDDGIVSCVKNGSDEGFTIDDEGVVSLA